jgi:hypothetical protein
MSLVQTVTFKDPKAAEPLSDQELEKRLTTGRVSKTARSVHEARKQGFAVPAAAAKLAFLSLSANPKQAMEVSDPALDRSDESAVAINPMHRHNIVAGAASFDGTQFINTAYVTKDGGKNWTTITVLTNTDEGAGIAFDDAGHCYYTTMQGGFFPVCVVSNDGGITWSAPAAFGSGDKTAVAARGQTALVGFDRINTEACAFTLDGGVTWTVHDFTDNGIGTAPLVSYDEQHFYIIYAALDNNIKLFASHDRGATWSGPTTIVAGNMPESVIAGPLSYEGGALTSPGTNVAIDRKGHLHLLYIDSAKSVPMYTTSRDQGATWSTPVNVNPERSTDAHMWPCLACTKHGDLQGGSVVFDAALGKYSILVHSKPKHEDEWETHEADSGPWSAAGPSPSFRIGFGDYFDCDCLPDTDDISVMAWSETADGLQPWRTFVRILDID